MPQPDLTDAGLQQHSLLLCNSYQHWTGKPLVTPAGNCSLAEALFNAPFVLVSHGTESIPLFNYANRNALDLFERDWAAFTRMPSRQSADGNNQDARSELMARVRYKGFITGCSGVRVTASGKRFRIDDAIVWNVIDSNDRYFGQAAMFDRWHYL